MKINLLRGLIVLCVILNAGKSISQNPPSPPPEQTVFGTKNHTKPVPATLSTISVFDSETYLAESLNYQTNKLSDIRIVGQAIEIQKGHTNGLYEAYFQSDENLARRDIKSMEIIAETIVVRSPCRLKQTELSIYARELRFEGNGAFKTTPEEKKTSPGQDGVKGGLAGADGLKAGNVTLHIGKMSEDSPGVRFDLTGGAGQQGGPGQAGVDGASVTTRWSSYRMCDSGACDTYTPPAGWTGIYMCYYFDGVYVKQEGETGWPTSGTDARPSGKPGEGGDGGTLIGNPESVAATTVAGGACGNPTASGSWYYGGGPGYPTKSKKVRFDCYFVLFYWWIEHKEIGSLETFAGTNAPVLRAVSAHGRSGATALGTSTNAWVHPLLLAKVLTKAKNDYLAGNLAGAESCLKEYSSRIATAKADPTYWPPQPPAPPFWQHEIEQAYNEIQVLLQRIANGLDYFGNPAGWVPMLSFEVNTTLFDKEIDRAVEMLYLAYWIKNKAATEQSKVNALAAARQKLAEEVEQAKLDYNQAVSSFPVLKNKALTLQTRVFETQMRIQLEEQKLLEQAGDPDWVKGLRLGLKFSAAICKIVPVYQPALGTVGNALNLGSDFNPDKPWATITGGLDIATCLLSSAYESASKDQAEKIAKVDASEAGSKWAQYLDTMRTASSGLSSGLSQISGFLGSNSAPSQEMNAKLEELKSKSPVYQSLVSESKALMGEQRRFTDELITTMQTIASLSDLIAHDILAINAMNRQVAAGITVLDPRATAYLDDMERRAYDRLLKYHYYMAKAYEYRLLRAYTFPLNLEPLMQKFAEIAQLNSDQEITPSQFSAFKGIFRDAIASVAATISSQYNSSPPDVSVPVRYTLSSNQIAQLNKGEVLILNPVALGWTPLDHENVRVGELRVRSMTTESAGGGYGSPAYVDVLIEHSGISYLKAEGAVYQFRHYNRETRNPIVWQSRYDPVLQTVDAVEPSPASDSLLRMLISGGGSPDELLLYSQPSAWADLKLSRRYYDANGYPINIRSLTLELTYDYSRRSAVPARRDLRVAITAVPDPADAPMVGDPSLLPYFTVSTPDCNQRTNALGPFFRTYYLGESVTLSAEPVCGSLVFRKWTDEFGGDLPGGANPSINVNMSDDRTITAQYVLPYYPLPVTAVPSGAGTIEVSPQPVNGRHAAGTILTVTARPASGYLLTSWAGSAQGSTPSTKVLVCANMQVTARFRALNPLATAVIDQKPISYFPFEDRTSRDVISTNHGMLRGSVSFGMSSCGEVSPGLLLAGGHMDFGEIPSFNCPGGTATIELLLRADWTEAPNYNPTIFADREVGLVNYSIHMDKTKTAIHLWNGTEVTAIPIPTAGTNWHHMAIVFAGGQWALYWDGVACGTQPLGFGPAPQAPTHLGSSASSGNELWRGAFDEVAFYGQALSPAAIQAHWATLLGGAGACRNADAARDFQEAVPAWRWQYLQSTTPCGGEETLLSWGKTVGNAGNVGYGGGSVQYGFNLAALVGTTTGVNTYKMFVDGEANAGVAGTDLLLHPGEPDTLGGKPYILLRYTVDPRDVAAFGNHATIAGSFRNVIPGGNSVEVFVFKNCEQLFHAAGTPESKLPLNLGEFNLAAAVAGGDTISFVVGNNGDVSGDETALRALVSLSTAPNLVLTIGRSGNQVTLQWPEGRLQQAPSADGPYEDVASAVSPYTTTATGTRFFRVAR